MSVSSYPQTMSRLSTYKIGSLNDKNFVSHYVIIDKEHASIHQHQQDHKWGVIVLMDCTYDLHVDTWTERGFHRIQAFDSEEEALLYCDVYGYQVIPFNEFGIIARRITTQQRHELQKYKTSGRVYNIL